MSDYDYQVDKRDYDYQVDKRVNLNQNLFAVCKWLIRDVWTYPRLIALRNFLDEIIEEKEEGGYNE